MVGLGEGVFVGAAVCCGVGVAVCGAVGAGDLVGAWEGVAVTG